MGCKRIILLGRTAEVYYVKHACTHTYTHQASATTKKRDRKQTTTHGWSTTTSVHMLIIILVCFRPQWTNKRRQNWLTSKQALASRFTMASTHTHNTYRSDHKQWTCVSERHTHTHSFWMHWRRCAWIYSVFKLYAHVHVKQSVCAICRVYLRKYTHSRTHTQISAALYSNGRMNEDAWAPNDRAQRWR